MIFNQYTRSTRDTVIESLCLTSTQPGDLLHPNEHHAPTPELSLEDIKREVWCVHFRLRTGFDQFDSHFVYFGCKVAAEECLKKHPVGSTFGQEHSPFPIPFRALFSEIKNDGTDAFFFGAGDPDFFLCYEVLEKVGMSYNPGSSAKFVLDWHGCDKIKWLKGRFGENWSVVAEFEYCLHHFANSSMAVIASKALYNFFISHNDYAAGYYYRELQMVHGGAEQLASDAVELRTRAGEGGKRASQTAKQDRLDKFLAEIVALADLYPRISEQMIVDQAFKNAVKAEANLWKQGKGQQANYETELRSDPKYSDRYFMCFPTTA